jgi:hypothetical protein
MAETTNTPPVGEVRRPGMDHLHHAFRTLTEAPRFAWPDDARVAFTVTLVLDYWEVNPPEDASPDPRIVSGSIRRDAKCGVGCGGGEALSGTGG